MNRSALYSLAGLIFVLDQATKQWVEHVHDLWPDGNQELIPDVFAFTYVHNTGGAFGILPTGTLGLALAAAVAAAAILYFTARARMPLPALLGVALALPLGGALGNLLDRVRLRYVIDFLHVHAGPHEFPVFNVADSAICVGVALLAIYYWRAPVAPQDRAPAPVPAKEES